VLARGEGLTNVDDLTEEIDLVRLDTSSAGVGVTHVFMELIRVQALGDRSGHRHLHRARRVNAHGAESVSGSALGSARGNVGPDGASAGRGASTRRRPAWAAPVCVVQSLVGKSIIEVGVHERGRAAMLHA
jgi:hypothetical protein